MYASRIVVSASCMPPLIGLTRQGYNKRAATYRREKKGQTSATNWAPKQAPKWTSGLELSNNSTHSREKKNLVLVSVKSGAEVGVGVEVSLFFIVMLF